MLKSDLKDNRRSSDDFFFFTLIRKEMERVGVRRYEKQV